MKLTVFDITKCYFKIGGMTKSTTQEEEITFNHKTNTFLNTHTHKV